MSGQSLLAANVADFADFSLRDGRGNVVLPGRLYVPPEAMADPTTPRPFILFLHGGGEEGTNNTSQINSNIDNLLTEAKLKGAFLYAPQSTSDWSSVALTNNVMTMIDRAEASMDVDPTRIYITGLSNGGGGTWNMLSRYPEEFAAGLPISGIAPASDFVPSHLLNTPIFAFHARDDSTVSVGTTHNVLNSIFIADGVTPPSYPTRSTANFFISNPDLASNVAVQQAVLQQGNVTQFSIAGSHLDLMYYELAVGGHAIWSNVYSGQPVYDWLFSHTTAVPEPPATLLMLVGGIVVVSTGRPNRREM
ncbi:MAG TPA: PHB depolymerase family esterase [Lacipirellulaceae bacterium]|nr:PHB depolymerase family esterase [Lacipirellulaceae bacterium]